MITFAILSVVNEFSNKASYVIKDFIADKIKSIAKIKPYENNEPLINFLAVLIFSSSPKLNFFINTPEATATAAAGVAIFSAQDSMSSNPFVKRVTNLGVAAKT
jgi:hypothetical protein